MVKITLKALSTKLQTGFHRS